MDECRSNPNVCHHGTCMNMIGSHTCNCFEGYQLSIDQRYCIGEFLSSFFFNSYRAGDSLKCSLLLKSEVYPIVLLLYLSLTALNLKSCKKIHVLSTHFNGYLVCFEFFYSDQFKQCPAFTAWKDQKLHLFVWANAYFYQECRNKC